MAATSAASESASESAGAEPAVTAESSAWAAVTVTKAAEATELAVTKAAAAAAIAVSDATYDQIALADRNCQDLVSRLVSRPRIATCECRPASTGESRQLRPGSGNPRRIIATARDREGHGRGLTYPVIPCRDTVAERALPSTGE